MPRVAKGHIEQLPSGSFRVSVYAGTDPLTRRKHPKGTRPSPAWVTHQITAAAKAAGLELDIKGGRHYRRE